MSLKNKVREKFEEAKRAGNREEKNLLSVILGDISTAEARSAKELPEADIEKLVRKMVDSNTETVAQLKSHQRGDDPQVAVLEREIALLNSLLPQTLSAVEIAKALEPVHSEILNAKNDGQATGVAMKCLKAQGAKVLGQDVSAAVQSLRTGKNPA
jgi:uncharacterized protein YqeY